MNISDFLISNLYENIHHRDTLEELIQKSGSIRIICPFISFSGAEWLIGNLNENTKIEVITEVSVRGIISGFQDPDVLKFLYDSGARVSYLEKGLHAKLFWFDQEKVVITSANLTENGLKHNFELGVLIAKDNFPKISNDIGFKELNTRLNNLWIFLKQMEVPFNEDVYRKLMEIKIESEATRNAIKAMEEKYREEVKSKYETFKRNCNNTSQIDIEIQGTMMFQGFKKADWNVFDHGLELSDENLNIVKDNYTEKINPLLMKFYRQLRHSRELSFKLDYFQSGCSHNRQLKKRFPNNRYLHLMRKRKGKWPTTHIGEPSFIIGMGKDDRSWLEVRTGVEEIYKDKLTPFGFNLLVNMRRNIDLVVERFLELGDGWRLSHGNIERDEREEILASGMTKEGLLAIINEYLKSQKVADFHVRKKYFLDIEEDERIITSSELINSIARDMSSLYYFFNLAHEGFQN